MTLAKTGQNAFPRQKIINCPNLLSALRLLLPLLSYPFIAKENFNWAFSIFLLGVATDVADGIIARKYNQITNFGKVLDSTADKIFFLNISYLLIPSGLVYWWGIIFWLEGKLFFISLLSFLRKGRGFFRLGANIYGKNKMVGEIMLVIELFLLKLELIPYLPGPTYALFGIIILFAVLSIIGHLRIKKK